MDYVLDVGGEYNPKENKFDHHQEGWNEKRGNGIPYATTGLIWKEYGKKITDSALSIKDQQRISDDVAADCRYQGRRIGS